MSACQSLSNPDDTFSKATHTAQTVGQAVEDFATEHPSIDRATGGILGTAGFALSTFAGLAIALRQRMKNRELVDTLDEIDSFVGTPPVSEQVSTQRAKKVLKKL